MTTLSLATCFLCLLSWPFARGTWAGNVVAILAAVSFAGFVIGVWFAAGPAIDAR